MSDVQTFGSLVLWTDVSDAVVSTLQRWMGDYLGRVCRQIGQPEGWLQLPGAYVVTNDANHFPEERPPCVVVAIPGTLGKPKREGNKNYRAMWDVRVTVFCQSQDRATTERLAGYYGGAIRNLLENKASLDGFAQGTSWEGEFYSTRVADRDQRTLYSCENRFCVDVRDVVQALGGPAQPSTNPGVPPADWPTVTTPIVNYTPTAIPD